MKVEKTALHIVFYTLEIKSCQLFFYRTLTIQNGLKNSDLLVIDLNLVNQDKERCMSWTGMGSKQEPVSLVLQILKFLTITWKMLSRSSSLSKTITKTTE